MTFLIIIWNLIFFSKLKMKLKLEWMNTNYINKQQSSRLLILFFIKVQNFLELIIFHHINSNVHLKTGHAMSFILKFKHYNFKRTKVTKIACNWFLCIFPNSNILQLLFKALISSCLFHAAYCFWTTHNI